MLHEIKGELPSLFSSSVVVPTHFTLKFVIFHLLLRCVRCARHNPAASRARLTILFWMWRTIRRTWEIGYHHKASRTRVRALFEAAKMNYTFHFVPRSSSPPRECVSYRQRSPFPLFRPWKPSFLLAHSSAKCQVERERRRQWSARKVFGKDHAGDDDDWLGNLSTLATC